MKTFARIIGLLLVLATLVMCFGACRKQAGDGKDTSPVATGGGGNSSGGTDDPGEPKELHALDILGERDLSAETITFLARAGGNMWDVKTLYAEEILSETINDAVFDRNSLLQEQYGFDIRIEESGATSYPRKVTNAVLGGSNAYDVITACGYDMAELAVAGVLRDLTKTDGIQLDGSWWNTTLNEQLTIANALFYLSGDIICEDNMAVRCVFFNKALADAIDCPPETLYEMANNREWTFAKMFEIASKAYIDLDDVDGKSAGDRFGLIGQVEVAGYVLMTAAGVRITSKNNADEPVLNPSFDYDVLDAIATYLTRDNSVMITRDALTPYKNSKVLFMTEVLGSVTKIRDWDIKTGIMPLPLYSETQESYAHFADGNCINLLALPTGNSRRLEKVLFMMEAMCIESSTTLNPAFYDKCLRGRYSYDEESADMLDIILNSYFIENANLFKRSWKNGDSNIQEDIVDAIATGGSISSIIASYSESLPKMIRETVSKLRDISAAQAG